METADGVTSSTLNRGSSTTSGEVVDDRRCTRRARLILSDNESYSPRKMRRQDVKRCSSSPSSTGSSASSSTSESSSETSSSETGSDSADEVIIRGQPVKVRPRPPPKARARRATPVKASRAAPKSPSTVKRQESDASSSDEDEENMNQVVISRKGQRDTITELIARILCRWWYVLADWPPADYDYSQELEKRKLKVVPLEEWEAADDIDALGFTKVYKISHFDGNAIDLRPLENKPCYATLKHYSELELYELLIVALKNQLAAVDSSPYRNTEQATLQRLKTDLRDELRAAEERFVRLKRRKREATDAKSPSTPLNGSARVAVVAESPRGGAGRSGDEE